VLSFAIRRLHADTGVVVTASHNPPQYNGYKAYWNDGSQVIPPHDIGIIQKVVNVKTVAQITEREARAQGLLEEIPSEIDDAYIKMVKSHLLRPELFSSTTSKATIVYTPLHGTGAIFLKRIMSELGLNVITVPEQVEPNGEFPTVAYPNPEDPAALALALELGKKVDAEVVMANDPDADRLGIAVPDRNGNFVLITGNQLGSLHLDYIALTRREKTRCRLDLQQFAPL